MWVCKNMVRNKNGFVWALKPVAPNHCSSDLWRSSSIHLLPLKKFRLRVKFSSNFGKSGSRLVYYWWVELNMVDSQAEANPSHKIYWFIFTGVSRVGELNRGRCSISKIYQQLTICQQMLKICCINLFLFLQCFGKTRCIYSIFFVHQFGRLKMAQGAIYLY